MSVSEHHLMTLNVLLSQAWFARLEKRQFGRQEVSWADAKALQLQDPQVPIDCAKACNLETHPDFAWTKPHIDNAIAVEKACILAVKSHQGLQFKSGAQLPVNSAHARRLDAWNGNNKQLEKVC